MKLPVKIIVLTLAFSAITLTSCDPAKKFADEISDIDSCQAVLDSVDNLYQSINFDSLEYMVNHVLENEAKFKKYYSSDTVDMTLGSYMNSCKGVRKSLKDIRGFEMSFKNEIAILDSQFTNLKTDILNDLYSKDEIKTYLDEEKLALQKFCNSFDGFYVNQKEQAAVFYLASPYVDAYVANMNIPEEDVEILEP